MGKSNYSVNSNEKCYCPKCRSELYLLMNQKEMAGTPSFNICFKCKSVFQVGVGKCIHKRRQK